MSFLSCKGDAKEAKVVFDGDWKIYHAERNGKVTKTLEGGVFMFSGDTSFRSNIFGEENLFTFEHKGGRMVTKSGEPELNFEVLSNGVDTALLSGKVKTFKMAIYLVKDSIRQ